MVRRGWTVGPADPLDQEGLNATELLDRRLIVVSGKGGVGKSAVAAGLALAAQRHGLRVLAIEMASAGGLANHLATGPLAFKPREARPGLHAMHIVRSEALLEYLSLQLRIPGMGRFGPVARAFDALATAAPAVREIIAMGKVLWEVRTDRWDLVIADGPPTGQIGSYLRAPKSIADLVPTGRVRAQSEWMSGILTDPELTSLILVTIPEELPTTETVETMEWLDSEDIVPRPVVIANRVLPGVAEVGSPPGGTIGEMLNLHLSLLAEQEKWLEALPADLMVPYLFGRFTPGEVAAHMSDELERFS